MRRMAPLAVLLAVAGCAASPIPPWPRAGMMPPSPHMPVPLDRDDDEEEEGVMLAGLIPRPGPAA
ncbi:hypothetical protein ACI6QG_07595 [Roseococcus sp. DSY-14]|uniref:hypothetical protein n=1 Tax=Roseococcus sp. DSY-14 TaxID=3369650 RepID=UPI00387AE0DD